MKEEKHNLEKMIADWDKEDKLARENDTKFTLLEQLKNFSITGQSGELMARMASEVFVMKDIAISGQWTTIYGAPNTGKTLLTLWMLFEQIENFEISGSNIFYVNADDNNKGYVTKTKIAEKKNIEMLVPNENGFTIDHVVSFMQRLAKSGEAKGIIFILDTLKKFTDLMDKRAASSFGNFAREFVSSGGTLICLAHTNKHKNSDGKGVYSGTSDIVDDCDCVFVIDKITETGSVLNKVHKVEFTNIKSRGNVASKIGFSYETFVNGNYSDLLASVKRIGEGELEKSKKDQKFNKDLEDDDALISRINEAIKVGIETKIKIIEYVHETMDVSKSKIKDVLEKRTGEEYALGYRWNYEIKDHNTYVYSLLPMRSHSK